MWVWRRGAGTTARDEFMDQEGQKQTKQCREEAMPRGPELTLRAGGQGRPSSQNPGGAV